MKLQICSERPGTEYGEPGAQVRMRKALKILLIAVCAAVVFSHVLWSCAPYFLTDPGKRLLVHSLNGLYQRKVRKRGMEAIADYSGGRPGKCHTPRA